MPRGQEQVVLAAPDVAVFPEGGRVSLADRSGGGLRPGLAGLIEEVDLEFVPGCVGGGIGGEVEEVLGGWTLRVEPQGGRG